MRVNTIDAIGCKNIGALLCSFIGKTISYQDIGKNGLHFRGANIYDRGRGHLMTEDTICLYTHDRILKIPFNLQRINTLEYEDRSV